MKHLRFILPVVLCCIVAGLMTSCLNDDDNNNGLSKEEQLQAFQMVAGSYSGNVIFFKNNFDGQANQPTDKNKDTLKTSFTLINDTTARINNMPVAALANQVKDATVAKALMNSEVTTIPIDLYTFYYSVSPSACYTAPNNVDVKATYGGQDHTLRFAFYNGLSYIGASYGIYSTSTGYFQLGLCLGRVWVDGTDATSTLLYNDGLHGMFAVYGHR